MQEKEKKPRIRFKGFTEAWEQRKFGEIFAYERPDKYIVSSDEYVEISKIPVLTANKAFILGYTLENKAYKKEKESIIFDDFTLEAKFVNFPYMVKSSAIKILTLRSKVEDNLRFNYELLNNTKLNMLGHARHYISVVQPEEVYTAKKNEQDEIAKLFTNIDNLITLHQRKYDKLVNVKKALLEKMFPKNGSNVPEIRFKGFTEAWEQRKLTEFVDFFNGQTYSPSNVQANGTLVLRSSNVQHGEISKDDCVYISNNVVNSSNVNIGDIIVVVRNGSRNLIGKHAQIKVNMPNTVIGAFMTGIRAKDSNFINALLSTQLFESEINKNMGATINQITGYMFANMEFYIPKNKEQLNIGKLFLNIDNLITLHQRKLEKLKNIKKSLLEKMFV